MSEATFAAHAQTRLEEIRARLAAHPGGVLETVAREFGAPLQMVLEALPKKERTFVSGENFERIWTALAHWGEVLFIMHTNDIVLECTGSLPSGSFGRGFFNIHGESPIAGHIRAENCAAIYFVDRLFHGRRSCSVQFFNTAGEAMFKVFVRRDASRELLADQVAAFEHLRDVGNSR
jgi:putative heme utilization carrier protein HutX